MPSGRCSRSTSMSWIRRWSRGCWANCPVSCASVGLCTTSRNTYHWRVWDWEQATFYSRPYNSQGSPLCGEYCHSFFVIVFVSTFPIGWMKTLRPFSDRWSRKSRLFPFSIRVFCFSKAEVRAMSPHLAPSISQADTGQSAIFIYCAYEKKTCQSKHLFAFLIVNWDHEIYLNLNLLIFFYIFRFTC